VPELGLGVNWQLGQTIWTLFTGCSVGQIVGVGCPGGTVGVGVGGRVGFGFGVGVGVGFGAVLGVAETGLPQLIRTANLNWPFTITT
jgi:hypothetical protein